MTHAELAKKIREAVYERATTEGGAISREQMDDAIERALAAALPKESNTTWPYAHMAAAPQGAHYIDWTTTRAEEWR